MRKGLRQVRSFNSLVVAASALRPRRNRNVGLMQSADNPPLAAAVRASAAGCSRRRSCCRCRGRRTRSWRIGERRFRRRRGGRRLRRFWLSRPHQLLTDRRRRRCRRLKLRNHRIGIGSGRASAEPVAGVVDHLHRNGRWLESAQRVGYREAVFRSRQGDRARRFAPRAERGTRIGTRRRRLELDLQGWWGRL
jgi:hypothetical protein